MITYQKDPFTSQICFSKHISLTLARLVHFTSSNQSADNTKSQRRWFSVFVLTLMRHALHFKESERFCVWEQNNPRLGLSLRSCKWFAWNQDNMRCWLCIQSLNNCVCVWENRENSHEGCVVHFRSQRAHPLMHMMLLVVISCIRLNG